MGIDIYAKWDGKTEAEYEAQITGFDTTAGSAGYLREAYHGGPYVTNWLMPEAFQVGDEREHATSFFNGGVEDFMGSIFAALGGSGLAVEPTVQDVAHRAGDGFPPDGYTVACPEVEIAEAKYPDEPSLCAAIPGEVLERRLPLCEAIYVERCQRVYKSAPSAAEWASFVAFVALYRRMEAEGRTVGVYASW